MLFIFSIFRYKNIVKFCFINCILVFLGACQNQPPKQQYFYHQPYTSILDVAISNDEKLLVTTSHYHCDILLWQIIQIRYTNGSLPKPRVILMDHPKLLTRLSVYTEMQLLKISQEIQQLKQLQILKLDTKNDYPIRTSSMNLSIRYKIPLERVHLLMTSS